MPNTTNIFKRSMGYMNTGGANFGSTIGPQNFSSGFMGRYGAASLSGGLSAGVDSSTGINPLLELTPNPLQAMSYGMLTANPFTAMGRMWSGLTGKGGPMKGMQPWKYSGAWGYKTLLTGIGEAGAGMGAKLSVGNVALSATQGIGRLIGGFGGMADNTWVQAMSNARRLGVAGMLNVGEETLKHTWAYNLGGRAPGSDDFVIKTLSGSGDDAIKARFLKNTAAKVGGIKTNNTMISAFPHKPMAGKAQYTAAKKAGQSILIAGGIAGRALTFASGASSLMMMWDIASFAGGSALTSGIEGMGDFTRGVLQYLDESRKPNMGRGRVPSSLMTTAAATERQRAVQASYAAKVNPSNRMYGNEASYQHTR